MRTKALLGLAVLTASAVTCVAQVYSLNIVGYVNKQVNPNKFYLLGNPLDKSNSGGNSVTNVIPTLPATFDGSTLFTFDNGTINIGATYVSVLGGWSVDVPAAAELPPGRGFYLLTGADVPANSTITFVGEVVGTSNTGRTNTLPGGNKFSLVASPFPAAQSLKAMGLTGQDGDTVYRFNDANGTFVPTTYVQVLNAWSDDVGSPPEGPTLNVGEGIFYYNTQSDFVWKQYFTVQ